MKERVAGNINDFSSLVQQEKYLKGYIHQIYSI